MQRIAHQLQPGADVVTSNPPYVSEQEFEELPRDVRDFEPRMALCGHAGADGLTCYRSLARLAPMLLRPHGLLVLEVGHGQAGAVEGLLRKSGWWHVVRSVNDLAGTPRCIVAKRTDGQDAWCE